MIYDRFKKKVKLPAYTKSDIWVFLATVPLSIFICNFILLGPLYLSDLKVFLLATLLFMGMMFIIFQICGMIALAMLKRFPDVKDTMKRIGISLLLYIIITVIPQTPLLLLYKKIEIFQFQFNGYVDLRIAFVTALTNTIITIIFEGLAALERWKASLFETEQLKKENLRSQLQSLKGQINPHFLFNSINSLSSLIAEDPDKAEEFLDEMSKVYRYLLRNNDDNLIPLSMELQFIHSYYHLLKTRYSGGINLIIDVPEESKSCLIPPLTLQILVENAVKHNIILKEEPLKIEIICRNKEELMVRNNLQVKTVKVQSNKIGLENIAAKYQLMNQPDILIEEANGYFTVTIPLIHSEYNESI